MLKTICSGLTLFMVMLMAACKNTSPSLIGIWQPVDLQYTSLQLSEKEKQDHLERVRMEFKADSQAILTEIDLSKRARTWQLLPQGNLLLLFPQAGADPQYARTDTFTLKWEGNDRLQLTSREARISLKRTLKENEN